MTEQRLVTISVARDFSRFPAGRFPEDGPYNGTKFRDEHLVPALSALEPGARLVVNFDGVSGFGSSFLEEAFGGLVRAGRFSRAFLDERLSVVAEEEDLRDFADLAKVYIVEEDERQRGG